MATVTIENINSATLSTVEKYALAILSNLPIEEFNQLKQTMQLDRPGVLGMGTLTAFVNLCQQRGIDLSEAGVNTFKEKHRLNNTGAYQGVIGPQTAGIYFDEICGSGVTSTPANDLNQAIVAAAQNLLGMCTTEGPDGGNNACAWSLNRVLTKAGIPTLGENPNYVPSLVDALKSGRGREVLRSEARAGDLVVAFGEAHIGVGLDDGCRTVLSNSSSRASFRWESDTDFDGSYGGSSTIYRLVR